MYICTVDLLYSFSLCAIEFIFCNQVWLFLCRLISNLQMDFIFHVAACVALAECSLREKYHNERLQLAFFLHIIQKLFTIVHYRIVRYIFLMNLPST